MGTYLLLASSIRRVRSMRVCLCAGCLEHWAVPTQIPFTFDLIRVPSISEFMSECLCVVLLPAVCFSHLHNRKKIQQLSVSSNHMALFFNLFSLKGFCVVCVCVCVYPVCVCVFPCILLNCLEWKCTRTSSPPYSTHTHRQTYATRLIQCLCGRPSGVACKYSRDERADDENVPSAL